MTHRAPRMTTFAAALGVAAAMAAAPALGQQDDAERQAQTPSAQQQPAQQQPAQQQPQQQEAASVSEEKLEQFVEALTEITMIRQTAAVELESAADMERAEQVHREAQEQMIEAVEKAGLSVDEYNRIATLMGTDPELSERIHSKLQESS
jgi:glucose/arabinose dehydrogenase